MRYKLRAIKQMAKVLWMIVNHVLFIHGHRAYSFAFRSKRKIALDSAVAINAIKMTETNEYGVAHRRIAVRKASDPTTKRTLFSERTFFMVILYTNGHRSVRISSLWPADIANVIQPQLYHSQKAIEVVQ